MGHSRPRNDVEGLQYPRLGWPRCGLRDRRCGGGNDKGVERLERQRVVGEADEDLACELVTALCKHLGDRGVGHRKEDEIAGDRLVRVVAVEHFDGVATLGDDGGDGLAHIAGTNDRDV